MSRTDAYPVERYLGIDAVHSPSFAATGDLLYRADTTGTPQVWRRGSADAYPERLTAHDERVSVLAPSPTRPEFVFAMDRGSDERDQLFRYDLETGVETALTDDSESIHSWGAWGPDGDRIAYAANRRESDTFDVHVQGRDEPATASEVVHEGSGGFLSVEAWGPDGDRLALVDARASFAQDVSVLELAGAADDAGRGLGTGELVQVNDREDARFESPVFGPEGGLYVLTNRPGDNVVLGRFDLTADDPAAAFETVVARDGWNVDGFALDRETGRLAYTVNVDGYSELVVGELADPTTFEATAAPDLDGVIGGLAFGPEADRLAVEHTASDRPYRAVVVDADTGAVASWADAGTAGIPRESFREPETIRYGTFDVDERRSSARETASRGGREIPAYWTLPEGVEPGDDAAVPVIVDVHGGPEHQRRPWFYPTKQFYLDRGYAVLEPNVRGSAGYGKAYTHLDDRDKRLDSVRDIAAAVEWLHGRPEVDDDRVVAYGRSYGGFMVLAAITQYPDRWAAAVDFVGIADFETFLENTGEWRRSHREQEYGELANRELLREISPIHDVDRIACPLFVQHGANDPRVPVGEAERIADAVAERGIPVETCIFGDEGHHTTSRANRIEQFERIADFLAEHVGAK